MSGVPGPIRILSVDDQCALRQWVVKALLRAAVIFAFFLRAAATLGKRYRKLPFEFTQTDTSGALRMQIKKKSDRWSLCRNTLNRSLGYGTAYSCELNL